MPNFIGPLPLVFLRITGACLLFWTLSFFIKSERVEKKDLMRMLFLAIFGIVVNQVFFIYGLSLTNPINSAIIMVSNPIMVFIFTLILLKERITLLKFSGLSIAVIGALLLLLFKGNFEFGSETMVGDLMTLINSASWAIFIVTVKPIMKKYNTVTVMKWLFLFGSFYMLPIGLKDTIQTNWHNFTYNAVFSIVFVVVATTFLAYLLNLYGLKELSSSTVSMYLYLQPFLASIFAIFIGEDKLTIIKIFSGILIIFGLYLVNFKSKKTTYD